MNVSLGYSLQHKGAMCMHTLQITHMALDHALYTVMCAMTWQCADEPMADAWISLVPAAYI